MIYDHTQLKSFLDRGAAKSLTIQCESNLSARRLSFVLKRLNKLSPSLLRISISQSEVTISPRQQMKFSVKEQ